MSSAICMDSGRKSFKRHRKQRIIAVFLSLGQFFTENPVWKWNFNTCGDYFLCLCQMVDVEYSSSNINEMKRIVKAKEVDRRNGKIY